jgi:hypothetical protein
MANIRLPSPNQKLAKPSKTLIYTYAVSNRLKKNNRRYTDNFYEIYREEIPPDPNSAGPIRYRWRQIERGLTEVSPDFISTRQLTSEELATTICNLPIGT